MKPIPFMLIMILIALAPLGALEETAVNFNTGYFGVGGNFPLGGNYELEGSITLLTIGMENKWVNAGFEFSPVKLFGWSGGNDEAFSNVTGMSLFNAHGYWNALSLLDGFFYMGPYASVNYFFIDDSFQWDRYVLGIGGHIGFRLAIRSIYYNIFVAEIGYRNISGHSKYFIGAKVDILAFFFLAIMAKSDSPDIIIIN